MTCAFGVLVGCGVVDELVWGGISGLGLTCALVGWVGFSAVGWSACGGCVALLLWGFSFAAGC